MNGITTKKNRILALVGAILFGGLMSVAPLVGVQTATAAVAYTQCSGIEDTPGLEVRCSVTVTNHLDLGTGVASSTIVDRICTGAAGTTPNGACRTRSATSAQLITSVSQCDAAGNGGGGNLFCSVVVVNDVIGAPRLVGVTVDECIGSGTGGGANPLKCSPVQSTSGATVTQCNGSVNGGGAAGRVRCTEFGATSAILVRVNQCNGSVNGGGSTATCSVSFTNHVTPITHTAPSGTAPGSGSGGSTGGGTGGSTGGSSGGHGGNAGAPAPGATSPAAGNGSGGAGNGTTAGARGPINAGTLFGSVGKVLGFTGVTVLLPGCIAILVALLGAAVLLLPKLRMRLRTAT
jgi:hypothetical protein